MSLESYYEDLAMSVTNRSCANMVEPDEIFFEDRMKVLIEDGHSFEYDEYDENSSNGGYKYTPFKSHGLRIDGYEYIQDRGIINLYLCHYSNDNDIQTITKTEIAQFLSNTKRFFENSIGEDFIEQLHQSNEDDVLEVAKFIYDYEEKFLQVRVVLVTNCLLSKTISDLTIKESEWFNKLPTELDVWDIRRFYDNETTLGTTESIQIDFVNEYNQDIPTLSAHLDSSKYHSFLCVVPGIVIAKLYKQYGARLLEANVRSFLQFRGKVNKGMRRTLRNDPDMFFAYNNGITATAEDCTLGDNGNITKLTNLQIVNGGQTTATLFNSLLKGDSDLEGVFVQMKLSIIDDEIDKEVVPNISRFANTQNKITDSDFFSNHPFHRKMEGKSRRIFAPMVEGQVRQTKWFYERSRGQYQNELGNRSSSEKRIFQQEFPKSQLITKTDLAKVAVIFDGNPNHAVKGAQIAFKHFAKHIQKEWEKGENLFNDLFYKKLISQQIIFNECRLLVMDEVGGNAIQPTIAYSLFMLNYLSNTSSYTLNFYHIWDEQTMYQSLKKQMIDIIEYVIDFFERQTIGVEGRSVLSYSKSNPCLKSFSEEIKVLDADYLIKEYRDSLKSIEETASTNKQARRDQDVEDELDLYIRLSKLDWSEVIEFANGSSEFFENDVSLLSVFPSYQKSGRQPTPRQLFAINNILIKIKDEGLDI